LKKKKEVGEMNDETSVRRITDTMEHELAVRQVQKPRPVLRELQIKIYSGKKKFKRVVKKNQE